MALDEPIFFVIDPAQVIADMVAFYESNYQAITGQALTLQPAQIERLIINMMSYRETLFKQQGNEACKQNLLQFSSAPILDYLVELVAVKRIPAQPAVCVVEFTLTIGHGNGVIPAGIRIATSDGAYVFTTDNATSFVTSDVTVTATCTAQQNGVGGNGYAANTVIQILDPQSYIQSGTNLGTTIGGTDDETDEQLRERTKLAPSAFSTAGPVGAYKYATFSADPTIIDVEVLNPTPGVVAIYPLVVGGITTPPNIIAKVFAACNDEQVRPLTDTVTVIAPIKFTYRLTADLTLFNTADQLRTVQIVTDNLTKYTALSKGKLGQDILKEKIAGLCSGPDLSGIVYSVNATLELFINIFGGVWVPLAAIPVGKTQFADCSTITVNVVATTNG